MSRRRLSVVIAAAMLLIALPAYRLSGALARLGLGGGTTAAASATSPQSAEASFEPTLGVPVATHGAGSGPVVIGASPQESPGEIWAYGAIGDVPAIVGGVPYADQLALLERTDADAGWQVVPLPHPPGAGPSGASSGGEADPLGFQAGRATAVGGVVLLTGSTIAIRDPAGEPRLAPAPGAEGPPEPPASQLLGAGEALFAPSGQSSRESPAYAAIEEKASSGATQRTGLLFAPYGDAAASGALKPGVLHYDGSRWSREPILGAASQRPGFQPRALACGGTEADEQASSPENCWLLGSFQSETAGQANRLALFRRTALARSAQDPSGFAWEQTALEDPQPLLGEQSSPSGEALSVTALGPETQKLTATAQGVWVDFEAKLGTGQHTDVSKLIATPGASTGPARVLGTWCFPLGPVCSQAQSLGEALPSAYQSFAWPGTGATSSAAAYGSRLITGLAQGARLELSEGKFLHRLGAGGDVNGRLGSVFLSPNEGWIGNSDEGDAGDGEGQPQLIHATPQPQGDQLQEMPLPLRHPLLAIAQAPTSAPGNLQAEAIAVGLEGEIGRYTPGHGWSAEALYDSSGKAQTPTLRGVAWPEPDRAYAVGDHGAMWLWRAETGLWEPDPAEELGFIGNLTAIAFSTQEPSLGYAVGKNGIVLRYGKSWERETLPAELEHVNFTSIAFAGNEALATYREVFTEPNSSNGPSERGGVAVKQAGEPWHVDPSAATLLAQLPHANETVLSKLAGLADGGAIAAGPGLVIERESQDAPWRFSPEPLPEAQNISALAAFRDPSGVVRAVVSIDLDESLNPNQRLPLQSGPWSGDIAPPSAPGQPPLLSAPDPLPDSGYVLKETASGWQDAEHMALAASEAGNAPGDMPMRPDPVFALELSPNGESGLAVGGQSYDLAGTGPRAPFETAAAMRFGAGGAAIPGDAPAPIATTSGNATFAVGGQAACTGPCSDLAGDGIGPDVSLTHALQSAAQIAQGSPGGLRGFLYTGGRSPLKPGEAGFERELAQFESLLESAGSLPVHAAPAPGVSRPGYYSFTSTGASGGPVRVIVLDFSSGTLEVAGQLPGTQETWLARELTAARASGTPAIVMGDATLGFKLPKEDVDSPVAVSEAGDAAAVTSILIEDGASAYLFDYPNVNVQTQLSSGTGHSIPAFGTGTLGYTPATAPFVTDYLGSSGFLLLEVDTAARNRSTNVAPVHASVTPNIGQLAIDATDGVLLRRSQVALFQALARRPPQGMGFTSLDPVTGHDAIIGAEPYDPIPDNCLGSNCAYEVPIDYTYSSSNPDVGGFVSHDPASANPRQVLLAANRLPVPDEPRNSQGELNPGSRFSENQKGEPINEKGEALARDQSGIFCAFNAGTTIVSVTTGGLTYSEPVTILPGSVEYPCGTVPLKNPPLLQAPAGTNFALAEPSPAGTPPGSPQVQALAPPPPPPIVIHPKPVHPRPRSIAPPIPFLPAVAGIAALRPAILPPPPATAQPSPPSGTSSAQVYQSAVAPEREREEQEAIDMVHNMAAYGHPAGRPVPSYLPAAILLFAFAGAGLYDVGRRRRRGQLAYSGGDPERFDPQRGLGKKPTR